MAVVPFFSTLGSFAVLLTAVVHGARIRTNLVTDSGDKAQAHAAGETRPEPQKKLALLFALLANGAELGAGWAPQAGHGPASTRLNRLAAESKIAARFNLARPSPSMFETGGADTMPGAEAGLKAKTEAAPETEAAPALTLHSKPRGGGYLGRAVSPTRVSALRMTDIWSVPDVPWNDGWTECLLLPHEPYPGTPPFNVIGEAMLQELEDREETRTQIFLNADGTVSPGATDGPPPAGFCGVWQCGEGQFQMTISRGFSAKPSMFRLTRDVETKGIEDIQYSVVRTYQGTVEPSSTGQGAVNGRIDLIPEGDREGWSNTTATSIAMYDKLKIDTPAIGYFVLDIDTAKELKDE